MRRRGLRVVGRLAAVLVLGLAGCGGESGAATATSTVDTVSPARAADLLETPPAGLVVLDVRTPDEFAGGHLAGAVNLDYQAVGFAEQLAALDREAPYLLYCRSGNRSAQVRQMMNELGFTEVYEIAGGIAAWTEAGAPVVAP